MAPSQHDEVLKLLDFPHRDCDCGDCWMRKVALFRIRKIANKGIRNLIDSNLHSKDIIKWAKISNLDISNIEKSFNIG